MKSMFFIGENDDLDIYLEIHAGLGAQKVKIKEYVKKNVFKMVR